MKQDKSNTFTKKPFKLEPGPKFPSDKEELEVFLTLKKYLEKRLFTFSSLEDEYELPQTSFKPREISYFNDFDNKICYREGVSSSFTDEQFANIWKDGTFSVESVVPGVPYIWKISHLVCTGKENIYEDFAVKLAKSFHFLYSIKSLYDSKHRLANAFYSLKSIFRSIKHLFYILFGLSSFADKESEVLAKVTRDFEQKRVENNPNYSFEVFQKEFDLLYRRSLMEFEEEWTETKKRLANQGYEEGFSDSEAEKAAQNRKYEFFKIFLEGAKFPDSFKKLVIAFFDRIVTYNDILDDFTEECEKRAKTVSKAIEADYSVKSKVSDWFEEKFEQDYKKAIEDCEKEFNKKLENSFTPEISKIVQDWRNFTKDRDKLVKEAWDQVPNTSLTYTFSFFRMKPYKAKEVEYCNFSTAQVEKRFELDKETTVTTNRDCFGWRFKFIFLNLLSLLNNFAVNLYDQVVNSSFGLKGLFCCRPELEFSCNSKTGLVSCTKYGFSYSSAIKDFNSQIAEDRANFFLNREHSLFGGEFGNAFNWIKNYFFYGLIGNILLLLGYPLISLVYIALAFGLNLILLASSPLYVIIGYLFNILVYDYLNADSHFESCFPLFYCVWSFALAGVFNLVLNPIGLVVKLIIAFVISIYACITFILIYAYQKFMFKMLKMFGKIPKVRSDLATLIEGPGVTAKIFNRIEVEDGLLFLKVQLEKEHLEHFRKEKLKILEEPEEMVEKVNSVFAPLRISHRIDSDHYQFKNRMTNSLRKQINRRLDMLPTVRKVKFSLNELVILKTAAEEIIQNYVEEHNLSDIWDKYKLIQGNWKRLTDRLLTVTFGEQILEALEETEVSLRNKSVGKDSDWNKMKAEMESASKKLVEMKGLKQASTEALMAMESQFENDYWFKQERAHYLNKNVFVRERKRNFDDYDFNRTGDMFRLNWRLLSEDAKKQLENKDKVLKKKYLDIRNS